MVGDGKTNCPKGMLWALFIKILLTVNYVLLLFSCREFTLAEIEHFVDPCDKSHPKFENVSSQKVTLYPSENQIEGKPTVNISLGDAVNQVSGNLSHGDFPVARETLSQFFFYVMWGIWYICHTYYNALCYSFATCMELSTVYCVKNQSV